MFTANASAIAVDRCHCRHLEGFQLLHQERSRASESLVLWVAIFRVTLLEATICIIRGFRSSAQDGHFFVHTVLSITLYLRPPLPVAY